MLQIQHQSQQQQHHVATSLPATLAGELAMTAKVHLLVLWIRCGSIHLGTAKPRGLACMPRSAGIVEVNTRALPQAKMHKRIVIQ